ncbi:glycine cleavage system H protein [Terrimicrobium sacchariphilum]|jgi:glycine cleavage system H protein|uniref:Glycine cleavage system H protein n=1 Tax=Terrimicrobium sacchariphilum TaxID=690879 RepID=A0A146G6C0_TERSA|nr:glycine cleavage system protein GcvH [Terrimicrobium sacchariphilum]GAT33130.1 glycine cleavage system H protein [Terrimicrobium sacchariphilum]
MNVPDDLKYAESHEWIRVEGDIGTVGITDHAQEELTDIVFAEPPKVGETFGVKSAAAVVESVKAASDIYTPVSGEIVEINPAIVDNPALLNTDPHGEGWIFKIKLSNPSELDALLDAAAYRELIAK